MATPKSTEKSQSTVSDTMQDTTNGVRDTLRDAADRFSGRDNRQAAETMMNNASETAGQLYEQANSWMRENSRTLLMIGAFAAVGVAGYLLGRNYGGSNVTEVQPY